MSKQLTEERLAEIKEALRLTHWRFFDRDDISMLVDEIQRLRDELSRARLKEVR